MFFFKAKAGISQRRFFYSFSDFFRINRKEQNRSANFAQDFQDTIVKKGSLPRLLTFVQHYHLTNKDLLSNYYNKSKQKKRSGHTATP